MAKKKQLPEEVAHSEAYVKDFFDMAVPSAIRFNVDHFICGDSYRSVWAIREYPPQTSDQALLARFGDKEAVTVHLYTRLVDGVEQRKILQNASRKNKLLANSNDLEDSVTGEGNLGDVVELLGELRKNREPLLHCAVFIELSAGNLDKLRELQSDVSMEMTREKISVDHLSMRQKEGFIACMPCGYNIFGTQYERVLPASAVANLFPFNYSGKTDKNGFYLGKDKFGTNIIADFDQRADDKTNSNVLILGNSGQGKSYLLKLILTNTRMSGKSVICLDAEQEYKDLCDNLGGCYVDLMTGEYIINPLEPKEWSDNGGEADADSPEAFRKATRLSQHISYLKDFFRVYKDFDDAQIDALEILLSRLYAKFGITDNTDYDKLKADDYPVMADLYAMVESEYQRYEKGSKSLFTEDLLRELCLGLNSMCVGAESKFFNGHTNISDDRFIVFGVKGLMEANMKLKNAMLFNILSYMNHISKLYDLWYEKKYEALRTYTSEMPPKIPLSQNKEFKSIKNDIIREAMRMSQLGEQKQESRTDSNTTSHHGSEKKTAPHHQTNSVRATAVTGFLKNLANTFRDKILGDDAKKLPTIDKRQRREIEEKRNAEMSMQ